MALSNFIPGAKTKADQAPEPPRPRRDAREASASTFTAEHVEADPEILDDSEVLLPPPDAPDPSAPHSRPHSRPPSGP
jgi:hypothetical protein